MTSLRISLCFFIGLFCGIFLTTILHNRVPSGDPLPTATDKDIERDEGFTVDMETTAVPSVATLMSESRTLDGVRYFLDEERTRSLVDSYAVFEAMVFSPNVKGPTLSFWTDDQENKFREIPYFPVQLATDLTPRMFAAQEVPTGRILVVRYLARMRSTAERRYYLEDQVLLGDVYMTIDQAKERSQTPPPDQEPTLVDDEEPFASKVDVVR